MEKCIPLEMTNRIAKTYDDVWTHAENMHDMNGEGGTKWDKRCYLPIGAGIAITSRGRKVTNPGDFTNREMSDAAVIAAVVPWRFHKQIYVFDREMEEMLEEQGEEDLVIPTEILNNLPYQCIYIKINSEDFDGFFVHFESDANKGGEMELRFLLCWKSLDKYPIPIIIHLVENGTVKDGVGRTLEEMRKNAKKWEMRHTEKELELAHEVTEDLASKMIQLVLYLCAENKEVKENPVQKKITKQPKEKKFIKDKFREVQMWNCGEQTGEIIRKIKYAAKEEKDEDEEKEARAFAAKTGGHKRPHSRRGHWHHYWVGKRDSTQRKLTLKWLPPMFIHSQIERTVTVNIIEK